MFSAFMAYQPHKTHWAEGRRVGPAQQTDVTTAELHRYPMGIQDCLSDDKDYPPTLESPHLISFGFKQLTSFSCHLNLQNSKQEMTTKT